MFSAIRSFFPLMLLLAGLLVAGTVGFRLTDGDHWSLFDCLYMSVITITTVGFGDYGISTAGKVFIIVYLLVGFGVFMFGAFTVGELIYRAKVRDWLARRRMDSAIKNLSDHFIICGFGRMGGTVCRYLAERGIAFVAIDRDEIALADCREQNWHYLQGDSTEDETLKMAGIERARGLAATMGSDADNLYVVLSARLLSKDLQIIARAGEPETAPKLTKAGANRVVALYDTGAAKMAQLLINPHLQDFIESFGSRDTNLNMAEIHVTASAPYAGLTLEQTDFRRRGVIIIAVRRVDGQLLLPPPTAVPIEPDDRLIAVGSSAAIAEVLAQAGAAA